MAAAFAKEYGRSAIVAESAGAMPSQHVHPVVVEAMLERGIDLSGAAPKLLTEEMANRADRAITMGCAIEDVCPAGLIQAEDWGLEDPSGKPIERVREIRDEIERRVRELLAEVLPSLSAHLQHTLGLPAVPAPGIPNRPSVRTIAW